jgi:hypothetical protein
MGSIPASPDAEGADPDEGGPPTVVFTDFELE